MSALKYYDTTSGTWKYLAQGVKGDKGVQGDAGPGVPTGGTIGQVLVKNSSTNYDTAWQNLGSSLSRFDGFLAKATGPTNAIPTANTSLISSTSNSAISGATVYAYNSGKFTFRGLNSSVITNGSGTSYYRNNATLDSKYNQFWIEFDYYGSNFDVRYNRVNSTTASQVWIWIDGVPVSTNSVSVSPTVNTDAFYQVVLPSTKQRRVRVLLANADFAGIGLKDASETIFPVNQNLLKVALFDGSWFAGGGGNALNVSDFLSTQYGEMLNVDYYNVAVSSTGYVRGTNVDPILGYVTDSTAGGPNWIDSSRLSVLTAINPDLVVFLGTTNDDNFTSSTYQLGAHATYAYNWIATNLPNTKIIVFTRGSNTETNTDNQNNATAIYNAAIAAPNVIGAVNIYGEGWVTGTQTDSSTVGTLGNGRIYIAGSDLHLNIAGNKYYASRMFSRTFDFIKTFTRS